MNGARAVGVALLSLVDALVPTVAAVAFVFLSVPYWDAGVIDRFAVAVGAGVAVFVGTLTVGVVATLTGYGPFPVTKATKWLWHHPYLGLFDHDRRRRR